MRRTILLFMLSAAFVAALALPCASSARTTYRIFDKAGHAKGKVSYSDKFEAKVTSRSGSVRGYLVSQDSGYGSFYTLQTTPSGGGGKVVALVERSGLYRKSASALSPAFCIGRVVKSGSVWRVKKKVNGRFLKVGRVSGRCRAAYAIGAARLLLW